MNDLRALAAAATPGPWHGCVWDPMERPHVSRVQGSHHPSGDIGQNMTSADAAYVAACDPQTILALLDALEGMVCQFAYWSDSAGGYHTGGLSALEDAFDALGWDDPHPAPESCCDEPGCLRQADCGWPTRPAGTSGNGGYRRTCGEHMRAAIDGGER